MKKIVFIDKTSGQKLTVRPLFNPHAIFSPLFQKVRKEPGSAPQVQKALNEAVQQYIYAPMEKLFKLEPDEKTGWFSRPSRFAAAVPQDCPIYSLPTVSSERTASAQGSKDSAEPPECRSLDGQKQFASCLNAQLFDRRLRHFSP